MDELIIPRIDDFAVLADADAQRVRMTVLDKLAADSARYLSEYSERFENVLNADDAATLFEEYNSDRARYRVAVHPAATWVRDELFRRALTEVPVGRRARVVFTAGGNAVGKSTALRFSLAQTWAHVVFDSTFSNPAHARHMVELVLTASWPITVMHVERPLGDALLSMLERGRIEGRVVSVDQMIHSHRGAAESVRALWQEFRQDTNFGFRFIANSSEGTTDGTIEVTEPRDYTEIRKNLHELLRAEYRAGRITEGTYNRVGGLGERN
jgi:hypothetical protein